MSDFATTSKLGVQAAQSGDMLLAEKYFRQAAELKGEPPEAIFNLCRLLHMQGRNQDVVKTFLNKVSPKEYQNIHPQLLLIASQSAKDCGDHSLAIETLTTLHDRHPENVETSILLSTLQIEAGRLSKAGKILETTIQRSGKDPSLLTNLAICEAEQGNSMKADSIHQEIIKNNPKEFLAYFNYGKYLATVGEISSAKESFKMCLELVPDAPEAIEAINQIEPKGTVIEEFYAQIEATNHHGAEEILKKYAEEFNPSSYLSCICHLRKENRSSFGEPNHYSPKHLVDQYNVSKDNNIDIKSLYDYVKSSETLIKDRPGKPTVEGLQTYEILKNSTNKEVLNLCKKIRSLANRYSQSINIPSIKLNENVETEISGWGVVLNRGGHQKIHTHPESIISGVVYLKTPLETKTNEIENGNIKFPCEDELSIAPYEGLIIFFPSYLPHSTVPTLENEERVCIAFNINHGKLKG
jgi:Flp pilus assembly protein TadD